jgi:hypothetical protein
MTSDFDRLGVLAVRWLHVMLLGILVLGIGCLSRPAPDGRQPELPSPQDDALPWAEAYGQFYTRDVARAQAEIPFRIVLPSYVPERPGEARPPNLDGPLRDYQFDGRVELRIFYSVELGNEEPGLIYIVETNYVRVPGDPRLNPDLKEGQIRGKQVIWTEGDFGLGPGVKYYFSQDNVYFSVGIYNFPREEAFKIVESMIE